MANEKEAEILAEIQAQDARNDQRIDEWLNSPDNSDNRETNWTRQQFSVNPVGEPYLALREYDGAEVLRGFTGTRAETQKLIDDHGLKVTELSPVTEGEYHRQALDAPRYLSKEREQIREIQNVGSITNENVPLHEAYLSGRRDSYNALRDELVSGNPQLAQALPPSIELDEIKVRQVAERQKDRSLELAR